MMTININYSKLYYLELINIISTIIAIKLFYLPRFRPQWYISSGTIQNSNARWGVCIYKWY